MKMEDVNEQFDEEKPNGMSLGDLMADMETKADKPTVQKKSVKKRSNNVNNPIGMKAQSSGNDVPKLDGNYHDIKGLPSKGKFYPKGTKIQARPLKVIEVKKLSSINEENADDIVNDVLRRTVVGIDVNDIILADKLYIVFWLRANTYRDSSYKVNFHCNKCKQDSMYHFELNSLTVNYMNDEFNPLMTLNNSGDELFMSLLTIGEERELYNFIENNKSKMGDLDEELLGLAFMIRSINGDELEPMDKYNYILDMHPGDFAQISTFITNNVVGIDPWINAKCEKCGGTSQIGITFREDFFIPKYIV